MIVNVRCVLHPTGGATEVQFRQSRWIAVGRPLPWLKQFAVVRAKYQ